ncbi:hypothetical protein FLAG1_06334 [Fusarium langsethiae]|uniref:Uncharacterized protein n=1 Tax=Fusarium langsethiae TaxID=179993 RepID=A0A0M9EWA4_FUSLA|nr:hypothetical protein FLAG1_06334 [Fusarium langsethiae]GKU05926.1 unnamed protein product [Fusarium langsethiae]GKU20155.1 unnamed protein product [Fusarium langsethiae]
MFNGVADMFPDVDIPFHAYLRVEYYVRPLLSVAPSFEQLRQMTLEVIRTLGFVETKGLMQERSCQAKLEKAIQKEDEAKQDTLRERLLNIRDDVYINVAAERLFSMIPAPSPEAIRDHSDKPLDVQLAATALDLAAKLRQRHDKSDFDWDGRIRG